MLFAVVAFAAPATPVTLTGSLGAMVGPPSLGAAASGDIGINLGRGGISVGAREALLTDDARSAGTVELQGRYYLGRAYVQGGFFHYHETPADVFAAQPLLSVIGSAPGIRHRSGLGAGFAYDAPLTRLLGERFGAVVELDVIGFPDTSGPQLYVTLDFGFSVDVGKPRSPAEAPAQD